MSGCVGEQLASVEKQCPTGSRAMFAQGFSNSRLWALFLQSHQAKVGDLASSEYTSTSHHLTHILSESDSSKALVLAVVVPHQVLIRKEHLGRITMLQTQSGELAS